MDRKLWEEVEAALEGFFMVCRDKLKLRRERYGDGRLGWLNTDMVSLFQHTKSEWQEMEEQYANVWIKASQGALTLQDAERFEKECADLANLSMMMADKVRTAHHLFKPKS